MKMEMEFKGLNDLVKALEQTASDDEIRAVNRKIVEKSAPAVKSAMSAEIPKSKDISISGRWFGKKSSVTAHAADNVPIGKVSMRGTSASVEVGWKLDDNSNYFYMKFINWGATARLRWGFLTHSPVNFVGKAVKKAEGELQQIAEQEYQAFLNRTIGD